MSQSTTSGSPASSSAAGTGRGAVGLHQIFDRVAHAHPDRAALEIPPGSGERQRATLTYAELHARAGLIASSLAGRVVEDDIVLVLLPRTTTHLWVAQLGILSAGAAYLCIETAFPDEHIRDLIADARAVALISDAAGCARAARLSVPAGHIIDIDDVLARSSSLEIPPVPVRSTALAYVIYTSGTTGQPKGVMIEHRSICNLVESDLETFDIAPGDRVAQGSSPAYNSFVEETWLAFAAGATLVVMDDATVRLGPDLVGWLQHERITALCPPPTLLRATGCKDPVTELPRLRLLYVGGEALPEDVAARWAPGRHLENGYGPTECAVTVLRAHIQAGAPISIGAPVRGNRAHVLDVNLADVPSGEPGELCISGVALARGYLGDPALTVERFPEHPKLGRIYRTGDLVRCDPGGAHHYLGRVDDQVKIRGHRVELGAVEAHLATCDGVREAACLAQEEGSSLVLVAHVVAADPGSLPDPAALRARLATMLPPAMVPARIARIAQLPRTAGGKLDRRALPTIEARPDEPAEARSGQAQSPASSAQPLDELEARILAVFTRALGAGSTLSREADFFIDLGGDSLRAAEVISFLREDTETVLLSVRDLYEAPTAAKLAVRARALLDAGEDARGWKAASRRESVHPAGATFLQSIWLGLGLVVASLLLELLGFVILPPVVRTLGLAGAILLVPALLVCFLPIWTLVTVVITVAVKRLLIGRYRPLRAPVWGSFYVRNWMVQRVAGLIPWGFLQDTVFIGVVLRALGARVGRRVHIHRGVSLAAGGWDLLEIGDDASLAQDAVLRLVDLEAGEIVVDTVRLEAGATLEPRATVNGGASLEVDAVLGALSWLPSGATIPQGERWEGVPARAVGRTAASTTASDRSMSPSLHGLLVVAVRTVRTALLSVPLAALAVLAMAASGVSVEQGLHWLLGSTTEAGMSGLVWLFAATAIVVVPLSLVASALVARALGRVRAGSFSRFGLAYLRILAKSDAVRASGEWLSGTLYWPLWLRLAGMQIGRKCEISTIIDVVPETVEIGDESFLADGIYLGAPQVVRGVVEIDETTLGSGDFVGNHVVVPAGARIPDDVLVGVSTVAGGEEMLPGTSWFGHPAFELPRREVVEMERRYTHEPDPLRIANRLFWETARFALPVVPLFAALAWFRAISLASASSSGWVRHLLIAPVLTLAVAVGLGLLVVVLKWGLLGRVRPGRHALWSCWCSRWDFLYVAWGMIARGLLVPFEGTLLLAWYLRAMGTKIGKRVVLGAGFAQVVDPDMLSFADDATVACMFQAHSFEDRVLKIDHVKIGAGASVATGALCFYGAKVGDGAVVEPHGVVMKHERLRDGARYEGCPVR